MNNRWRLLGKVMQGMFVGSLLVLVFLILATSTRLALPFEIFSVQSGSMAPAIGTGSLVFVSEQGEYRSGEVITFRSPTGVPITHRILETVPDEHNPGEIVFRTQGDANDAPDFDLVSPGIIVGKVVGSLPWMGYLLSAAKSPAGFIFLVVVPATIIIYNECLNVWGEMRQQFSRPILRRRRVVRQKPVSVGSPGRIVRHSVRSGSARQLAD